MLKLEGLAYFSYQSSGASVRRDSLPLLGFLDNRVTTNGYFDTGGPALVNTLGPTW